MPIKDYTKDPEARADVGFDWTKWLAGDTIATSEFFVSPTGSLAVEDGGKTLTTTKVWLTAGTLDSDYQLTNRITTAGGRIQDWTIPVFVRTR